jgi:hypothetical protein
MQVDAAFLVALLHEKSEKTQRAYTTPFPLLTILLLFRVPRSVLSIVRSPLHFIQKPLFVISKLLLFVIQLGAYGC